jgi:putative tricarboxylic transport membrane protein
VSKVDFCTGLGLMALSVGVYVLTQDMAKVPAGIGPGDYPRVIAVGLFVLGAVLAGQSARRATADVRSRYPRGAAGRVAALVATVLAYVYVLPHLGFVLATPLFLIAAMLLFGVRRPVLILSSAVGVTLAVYWIFYSLFQILLPKFSLF